MAFFAGYTCGTHCSNMPCRTRFADRGRSFKVSVLIHNATVEGIDGPGLVQNERPFVGITVGDKKKETELGDWSQETSRWCFKEVITMEVATTDEMSVVVDASKQYNLYVASVSVQNHRVGELCFPVSSVLPRLRPEDRDAEGLIYATPIMGFDVTMEGKVAGKVYLSFETKNPPQAIKRAEGNCCGLADGACVPYRGNEDESTTAGSDTERSAPERWRPTFMSRDSGEDSR